MNDYSAILNDAINIAESGAQIAQSHFRHALLIETKSDDSPVTIADKKTEEYIRSEIQKKYPSHGIIGEEFGSVSEGAEFVWTVDPIDGTRSFIRGIPLFGTLLGVLHHGKPAVGVMVLPALQESYWGATGLGAFCNGHSVHVSQTSKLNNAFVSVGDTHAFKAASKSNYLFNTINEAEDLRGYTDCFGHALVIRGAVDAMIDPVVSLWDIAPIACIVKEAGGDYFDFTGNETVLGSSFITCNPALKEELLSLG